jgi:hypothetical protein
MKHYPLLLAFKGTFFGRGFVAEVDGCGRLLASESLEASEWWLYGVNPGAIAASGATLDEAHADLRHALIKTMEMFAAEAPSFEAFSAEVHRYFLTTNEPVEAERREALARVRATAEQIDGLPTLQEQPPCVNVTKKRTTEVTPDDNTIDADLAKAA